MPPSDWLSWEFWATALYAVLDGPRLLAAQIWAGYVANRENLVPIATLLGAVTIAWAALKQARTASLRHEEQTRADRERRITESMAKAGEQLGSDKLETRLIGIYTLERIARESAREYWPIMETLTAFVRERAPWPPRQVLTNTAGNETKGENTSAEERKEGVEQARAPIRPATDIQAVLTVLGRRDEQARQRDEAAGRRLDLAVTDLRGAHLVEAHLEGADLRVVHLEGADLWVAHLRGADLWGAHLEGADLVEANLERAEFRGAHLEDGNLGGAHLENADLGEAHLEGAHLRRALGLTREQLAQAFGDAKTKVTNELRPAHWPAAADKQPDAPDNAEQP